MAPFRPTNLNKRLYPGNGNIIGPTRTPSVNCTTTTCCSFTCAFCGSCSQTLSLGCRCALASCPCCHACTCCLCTVCDRTIPSGRWRSSQQYTSRINDSWGNDSCSSGAVSNFNVCCATCFSTGTDYKGFYIAPTWPKWFVAPSSTQVNTSFYNRNAAVTSANNAMGCCSWFVPSCSELQNPGFACRSYWDNYTCNWYWSNTEFLPTDGFCGSVIVNMTTGEACCSSYRFIRKSQCQPVRAFRQAYV